MADSVGDSPSRRKKRVVVVRRAREGQGVLDETMNTTQSSPKKRTVVVARPARPGETLVGERVDAPATATFRYDARGDLIPHSYLGEEEEDDDEDGFGASVHGSSTPDRMAAGGVAGVTNTSSRLGRSLDRAPSARSFMSRSQAGSRRSLTDIDEDPVQSRLNAATRTMKRAQKARKRDEKQRADLLKGLTIHERTALLKEERARKRWEQQQQEWQRFKSAMARKLGRDESKLVVSHAEEYREMVEEYDMIQKATPPDQKHGSEYWMMSLRGEGTRYVAVGNIFSGLFCPVKDDDKPLAEAIRRPKRNANGGSSANDPKSWRNAHALQRRKRQLKHRIQDLRPHVVDETASAGLSIVGEDLFTWANRSAGMTAMDAAQLGDDPNGSPGPEVDDADHGGSGGDAGAGAGADADAAPASIGGVARGPRLSLQVITDAATLPGEQGGSLGLGNDPSEATMRGTGGGGPSAVRGWPRVLFDARVGNEARSVLRLCNTGTTALFYKWQPVNRGGVNQSGATIRPSSADSEVGVAVAPRGVSRFLCATQEGVRMLCMLCSCICCGCVPCVRVLWAV